MIELTVIIIGICIGSALSYYAIIYKRNSNEKVLDSLKTSLTVSDSNSSNKQAPVESDSERLSLFNIKDTKNLHVNISDQDKEYLLTKFIKYNKRLVPYGNIIDNKDFLYPTMKFSVYLSNKGILYHDVPGVHMRYGFTLDKAEMKELLGSIHSECYELILTGGPYRVFDELTGEYTEFKDNPLTVSIEVPLKLFIKTK